MARAQSAVSERSADLDPRVLAFRPIVLGDGAERMRFRPIPPGRFRMGSRGYSSNEEPAHWVRVPEPEGRADVPPFWLGATPVTQAQLARWTGSGDYRAWLGRMREQQGERGEHANHFADRPNHPAESVNWWEALGFCEWLTRTKLADERWARDGRLPEGWMLRASLPAEAHWEYACRAGTDTEYSSGDGEAALREVGWFDEAWGEGSTHPVGLLPPNRFGLFDMHGNVWEWCLDAWDAGAYRRRMDGADAVVPGAEHAASASLRVVRGGSWIVDAWGCRSAYRLRREPGARIWLQGFRVCLFPGPVVP